MGGAAAQVGKKTHLYKPYKVSTWNTIPKSLKAPNGLYTGDYWGAMSFLSVSSIVKTPPKHWDDLLSSSLRNMVAIDGDPTAASDAFSAVYAAALNNGGSLDGTSAAVTSNPVQIATASNGGGACNFSVTYGTVGNVPITVTASLPSGQVDPNLSNNSASAQVAVAPKQVNATADLAVFEIEPPFTPVRLKARYKALVKLHHPDAHGGDKVSEEKLKIINQAYATLKASYFS